MPQVAPYNNLQTLGLVSVKNNGFGQSRIPKQESRHLDWELGEEKPETYETNDVGNAVKDI